MSLEDTAFTTAFGTATLHEAVGRTGVLPEEIRPVRVGMRVAGPALPVRCAAGDNLWLHRAVYAARPGDVLVCDVHAAPGFGYWGEVLAVAAQHRGVAGLVINGGVRDTDQLAARAFPTFCTCISVRGTTKDPDGDGQIGGPVSLGGTVVHRGDLVVGDADGVIVLARAEVARTLARAQEREDAELAIMERLAAGESTIDIYGLPRQAS